MNTGEKKVRTYRCNPAVTDEEGEENEEEDQEEKGSKGFEGRVILGGTPS